MCCPGAYVIHMMLEEQQSADPLGFSARGFWIGGDLQTLRNYLVGRPADLSAWPERRLEIDLADGSGDRILAKLHGDPGPEQPLAVLLHGLTGCEDSLYIRRSARTLLEAGYAVLRMNHRGAAPGRALARQHYHAGRSADICAVLRHMSERRADCFAGGLFLMGFSLGANMLLKFLAEEGRDFPIRGAVSVSAPVDLQAAQQRLMAPRNLLYHRYLLARMKEEARATPGGLEEPFASRLRQVRSVYEYDDRIVGPRNGFEGAEDYYARCSAKNFLSEIAVPTLVVHAGDDPWIPAASYDLPVWRQNGNLKLLMSDGGGHVGFHDAAGGPPWHDRRALSFFAGL